MAENLLALAKSYISDKVVDQVSTMIGESPSNTQKSFDGAFPTLLSGLVQKGSEPGGASSVMDLVGEVMSPSPATGNIVMPIGGISGQLSNLLDNPSESNSLFSMGTSIVRSLFGDKIAAVTSSLADYSGTKQSSASSLMSIAAPVLLSVLGKKLADDGTGISGLAGILSSQTEHIQSALPPGISSILGGFGGLGALGNPIISTDDSTPITPEPLIPPIAPVSTLPPVPSINTAPPVPPTPESVYPNREPYTPPSDTETSEGGNRWLPWLLLALGAVALFFGIRSCQSNDKITTTSTTDSTTTGLGAAVDSAGSTIVAAADTLSVDMAKLGAFFKRKLPSGVELNIPEKGIENNLVQFIEDENRPVDKTTWFNFGRLLFDTGKATLKPNAKEEVTNIAEILKAFPNVTIKIGGYTDNTGSAAVNKKLSQDRADTVMNELVQLGIGKSRLEAEGYGPEHPVASNDTAEGRAENRRIAVRVTKK